MCNHKRTPDASRTSAPLRQLKIEPAGSAARLAVKVTPAASRTRVVGVLGGALKIQLATAAEKGKANQALVQLLARLLDVRPTAVRIASGQHSPNKQLLIEGIDPQTLRRRLARSLQ